MRRFHSDLGILLAAGLLVWCTGCTGPNPRAARDARIAAAARPLLTLAPDAVWTDHFNTLVAEGPAAIEWLMRQPALTQPAHPDSLQVMLHTSLVRLLAHPAHAPKLSASAFETTLGVLHFDPRAFGEPLGPVLITGHQPPARWTDLYPTQFDQVRGGAVALEADRQILQTWWRLHRNDPMATLGHPLTPQTDRLWPLLARRYADAWHYQPEAGVVLVSSPPREPVLLQLTTYDYNLTRAACIWLGSRDTPAVTSRLIELVGHPARMVAYNARLALRYSPDERVRNLIAEFDEKAR
jgi:hypothetical protein